MIKDYIIIGQELGEGHFGHAYKVQKKILTIFMLLSKYL